MASGAAVGSGRDGDAEPDRSQSGTSGMRCGPARYRVSQCAISCAATPGPGRKSVPIVCASGISAVWSTVSYGMPSSSAPSLSSCRCGVGQAVPSPRHESPSVQGADHNDPRTGVLRSAVRPRRHVDPCGPRKVRGARDRNHVRRGRARGPGRRRSKGSWTSRNGLLPRWVRHAVGEQRRCPVGEYAERNPLRRTGSEALPHARRKELFVCRSIILSKIKCCEIMSRFCFRPPRFGAPAGVTAPEGRARDRW